MCFEKLIDIFLLNNGNPNELNAKHENAVHALCSKADFPELRAQILKKFIEWKSIQITTTSGKGDNNNIETVSLNRVDEDGNAAIHHAAINGLELCVEILVRAGAITSIVNFSQRTCCELADINAHKELGTMIELALVYQPDDDNMIAFRLLQNESNNTPSRRNQNTSISPVTLTIDSVAMHLSDIDQYLSSLIYQVCVFIVTNFHSNTLAFGKLSIAPSRAEVLLNTAGWDVQEVEAELTKDKEAFLKLAHLTAEVEHSYIYENDTLKEPLVVVGGVSKSSSNTNMKISSSKHKNNSSSSGCGGNKVDDNCQHVNNISTGTRTSFISCKLFNFSIIVS
jgi:hypothetical protein